MSYPICKRHTLLRVTRSGTEIISTSRLYLLLGNPIYQRACLLFKYKRGSAWNGPLPDTIEDFLRTDPAAVKRLTREANKKG